MAVVIIISSDELFRFSGYKFFQVKRFEVSHILEILFGNRFFCEGEHHFCQRAYVINEMGVGMRDFLFAFRRSVTKEVNRPLFQIFGV